jgi:UDP-glucose 4-epimerase
VPPEMLAQLRFGRGVDNRRLKASGAPMRHTTRETVQAFAEHLRVAAIKDHGSAPYRYEREVEEFLRYSPSVRREADAPAKLQG